MAGLGFTHWLGMLWAEESEFPNGITRVNIQQVLTHYSFLSPILYREHVGKKKSGKNSFHFLLFI